MKDLSDADGSIVVSNCTNHLDVEIGSDENVDIRYVTEKTDVLHFCSFFLELKDKETNLTIRSIQYRVNYIEMVLEKWTEWYIPSKCHYLLMSNQYPFLLSLRERYIEYYFNITNYLRLDIAAIVGNHAGTLVLPSDPRSRCIRE